MFLHIPKPIEYSKLNGKETSGEEIYEVYDKRENPSKVIGKIRFPKGIINFISKNTYQSYIH